MAGDKPRTRCPGSPLGYNPRGLRRLAPTTTMIVSERSRYGGHALSSCTRRSPRAAGTCGVCGQGTQACHFQIVTPRGGPLLEALDREVEPTGSARPFRTVPSVDERRTEDRRLRRAVRVLEDQEMADAFKLGVGRGGHERRA